MWSEFKAFLLKTNALALAVGVIIGVALGAVVTSLVNDVIMPPVGLLIGGVNFADLKIVLQEGAGETPEVAIAYGLFINAVIAFIVIAFVVWQISRGFLKEAPAAPPTPTKTCPFCMEANAVDASRCRACTSEI
jgi:large conductance mechanosensitive channel